VTGAPSALEPRHPDSGDPSAPTLLILKAGGSLFSDKHRDDGLDESALTRWAQILARLAAAAPGRLIFISGGGSVGHGAVRHLDASDPSAALRLTHAVFNLKWTWTRALQAEGIRAMPLQLAAMCRLEGEQPCVDAHVVSALLAQNVLPVLSGDCVINAAGVLEVFGSDRVAEALLEIAGTRPRVVALTDVPGIFAHGPGEGPLLRLIDPAAPDRALAGVGASSSWDTSSSMAGKLDAFLRLARRGAECFVMRGDPERTDLRFLLEPVERWTEDELFTRIAARPPASAPGSA
jgi:isopentenyl phosphate kinase